MVVVAMIAILATMAIAYSGENRANLRAFSEDLVGQMETARIRSTSTRKWNRVWFDVDNFRVEVDQATVAGMAEPEDDEWEVVAKLEIPKTVTVYAFSTTVDVVEGNSPTEGGGLDDYIVFKPDGTSNGGTIYIEDSGHSRPMRILVYRATGTAFPKEHW